MLPFLYSKYMEDQINGLNVAVIVMYLHVSHVYVFSLFIFKILHEIYMLMYFLPSNHWSRLLPMTNEIPVAQADQWAIIFWENHLKYSCNIMWKVHY